MPTIFETEYRIYHEDAVLEYPGAPRFSSSRSATRPEPWTTMAASNRRGPCGVEAVTT